MISYPLSEWMDLAQNAARQAGAILSRRPDHYLHINAFSAGDIKLQADVDSEVLIRKILAPTELPVVGEEQGGEVHLIQGNQPYWVIDPLDGTYNYVRGLPLCCVSIGLMIGKEPLLGVIYDFNHDTLYSAIVGESLYINGHPHAPQWLEDQSQSLLLSSLRYDNRLSKMVPKDFKQIHGAFKKVRFFGTAALSLAWVAVGHAEGYQEYRVHLWDVAAGLALLKSAGGHFHLNWHDDAPFAIDCFASSQKDWMDPAPGHL